MENVDGMIGPGGKRKPFVRFRLSEPWIENFRHAGNSNNLIPTQCNYLGKGSKNIFLVSKWVFKVHFKLCKVILNHVSDWSWSWYLRQNL